MTSSLPPKRRDSRTLEDLIRQDRTRLAQLDRGLVFGRFPSARPLKPRPDGDDFEDDFDDLTILFENTDVAAVPAAGRSTPINLAHVPIEGSEQVFYRGMALRRSDWYYSTDRQILIPGEPWFKAGDLCWVNYAYEDGEADTPDPPNPILVGVASAIGATTSIALPPGVIAGDLIIVACAAWETASTSDPRIVGTHQAFGAGELVAWGYADGSGSPLAVTMTTGTYTWAVANVAVYRGVKVTGSPAQNTSSTSTLTAATIPNAYAALVAVLAWNGTVAGVLSNTDPSAWTTDQNIDHVNKTHALIGHWVSESQATTPAGSFSLTNDNVGFGSVTLQLEGT